MKKAKNTKTKKPKVKSNPSPSTPEPELQMFYIESISPEDSTTPSSDLSFFVIARNFHDALQQWYQLMGTPESFESDLRSEALVCQVPFVQVNGPRGVLSWHTEVPIRLEKALLKDLLMSPITSSTKQSQSKRKRKDH